MADDLELDDLLSIHESRSKIARETDEALKAEIAPNEETWAMNPSEYDWPSVDTPGASAGAGSEKDIGDVEALESEQTVFRVEQRGLSWAVTNESSNFGETSAGPFQTKEDAVQAGRRKRNAAQNGVLIIEREDGTIQRRIG